MRIAPSIVVSSAVSMLLLAACSTGGDDGTGSAASGDGTFTTAITADPGNLHPHLTVLAVTLGVDAYMYDKLVHFTRDGEEQPWLAESWKVRPDSVTYTIQDGVTCSDGSPLTASDVAANFDFITDPANGSPLRGVLIPEQLDVSVDDQARSVTIRVDEPDPFLLQSTGDLLIACRAGLDDPGLLKSEGIGTGMYEMTEAVPNDHYTFQRRDEYAWGPAGAAASDPSTQETITLRVIQNETTAVNLFISGELDAVSAVGPDRERLEGSYEEVSLRGTVGQLFFNQADGRPGAEPEVRDALAEAVDFSELSAVITGGYGEMSESAAAIEPTVCDFDSVEGNVPEHDPGSAEEALDAAGWTEGSEGVRSKDGQELSVTLVYNSTRGEGTASAAERIAEQWDDIGVEVTAKGMPPTEYNEVVFGTGAWEAALLPVNVRLPSQLVPFLSGTTPPEGVNFAHIDNAAYTSAVNEAMHLPGEEGCPQWQEAEEALFAERDMLLFADETIPFYLNGVTAEINGNGLIAATIRSTS